MRRRGPELEPSRDRGPARRNAARGRRPRDRTRRAVRAGPVRPARRGSGPRGDRRRPPGPARGRGGGRVNRYCAPLIVALVALVPVAVGQGKIDYDGSEVFRFALDQNGLKPLTRVQQAMESPRISMIIAFGDTAKLNQHFSATFLWQYLQRGGAVLIATDQRTVVAGRDWGLSTFGIFVTGEPLTADQQDGYKSLDGQPREDRPFVWPRPAFPGEEPSPWDLFKGVPANGDEAI